MERILCIKIASRGDLVLAAPTFRALREARPAARLDLLVGETCVDVAEHLPFFDRIRTIDDRELFTGGIAGRIRTTARMYDMLRDAGAGSPYSEVLVFHRDWRYGMIALAAGVPVRRGFRNGAGSKVFTHAYLAGEHEHHALQYAGMAGVASASSRSPAWAFHPGERDAALAAAARHGFVRDGRPVAALGFGGGNNVKTQTALKSWPVASYAELAQRLTRQGYQVVWVGDVADASLLPAGIAGLSLAGRLSVAETAAVLSACDLVVSNDTLTLHLADAMGIRSVGIFGPTHPELYGPRDPASSYLWMGAELSCSPCHRNEGFPQCAFGHRCMTSLTVDAVMAKLTRAA